MVEKVLVCNESSASTIAGNDMVKLEYSKAEDIGTLNAC